MMTPSSPVPACRTRSPACISSDLSIPPPATGRVSALLIGICQRDLSHSGLTRSRAWYVTIRSIGVVGTFRYRGPNLLSGISVVRSSYEAGTASDDSPLDLEVSSVHGGCWHRAVLAAPITVRPPGH